jgi:hypothetical protein
VDADIIHAKHVEESLCIAQEELARARDEVGAVPQAGAAPLAARVRAAEASVASLQAALTTASAVAATRKRHGKELTRQQEYDDSKLLSDIGAQLAGRDLVMVAPVLGLKVQGITVPVTDEPLPASVEVVKAALRAEEEKEEGAGANGASAGAGSKRPLPEASEEEAEEGAGEGAGEGEGASAAAKKAARKDRRTPEEDQAFGARIIALRYASVSACGHCGAHATKEQLLTCGDCRRTLCGRGDRSPDEPRGQPCIDLVRCRCGTAQCYTCYLGADARMNTFWQQCSACETPMCPKELQPGSDGGPECEECGQAPLCYGCRAAHGCIEGENAENDDSDD